VTPVTTTSSHISFAPIASLISRRKNVPTARKILTREHPNVGLNWRRELKS
jgi:hypothetical protein